MMTGVLAGALATGALRAADWPTWGGREDRNMVSGETGLPADFDPGDLKAEPASQPPGRNVKWVVPLGSRTFSTPVVAGGRVFIGTNNGGLRDPKYPGDRAVLLCLNESDGSLLWQLVTSQPVYPLLGSIHALAHIHDGNRKSRAIASASECPPSLSNRTRMS